MAKQYYARDSVRVKIIEVEGKKLVGVEVSLPNSPPLIVLAGEKGFAMCGLLNISVAEKIGVAAVRVPGVSSLEELLDGRIADATSTARSLGLTEGSRLRDVIHEL